MMKDRISVAMTTYNGSKFLKEQLDSIYSQSIVPFEVVVIDDCSKDSTVEILEEYKQKFGLIYLVNENNIGVNKNFERAILACTGDYIALSDQDDKWMPDKIEITYKRLKSIEGNSPALVSSASISTDENLNIIYYEKRCKDSDSYVSMLIGPPSQGCTMMMNRALLKFIIPLPFDSAILFDSYISITAAMIGNTSRISRALMYYRHHSSNVCGRLSSKPLITDRIKNKFKDKYPNFISNRRFNNFRKVELDNASNFVTNRKVLFYKLLTLDKRNITLFESLKIIWSIKEINFCKKFSIMSYKFINEFIRFKI